MNQQALEKEASDLAASLGYSKSRAEAKAFVAGFVHHARRMSDDHRVRERERIRSILRCQEAKGREGLADHLAFQTDVDPEQAKKLLAAARTHARDENFFAAMANISNPTVGVDGPTAFAGPVNELPRPERVYNERAQASRAAADEAGIASSMADAERKDS
jgi:hypothetical protein